MAHFYYNRYIYKSKYKKLVEKKVSALILCCGDLYREADDVDLDPYMYRNRHYDNGKIPAVCIRMKDAEKVLRAKPQKAHPASARIGNAESDANK